MADGAMMARYLEPGYLLFCGEDGILMAAPFDLDGLQMTGSSSPLSDRVWVRGGAASQFAVSSTGTLAYFPGTGSSRVLVWVDRQGNIREIDSRLGGHLRSPALSPDGTQIAFVSVEGLGRAVWVFDIVQKVLLPLASEGVNDLPFWHPDGDRVGFVSDRSGALRLYSISSRGGGDPRPILDVENTLQAAWTSDGRGVIFTVQDSVQGSSQDIYYAFLGSGPTPVDYRVTSADEGRVAVSPDGRWLAYTSNSSGLQEVYVQPFPGPGDRTLVSTGTGGTEPVWAHSGEELFYRNSVDEMVAVRVSTEGAFAVLGREVLFPAGEFVGLDFDGTEAADGQQYAVTPDDQTFLMAQWSGLYSGPVVALNFGWELKARVGGGH
ncbi:MAG: hypothetical protein MUO50_10755 [Longimicrobiales bacterium]|nr:hypothetical protein [Longimicrobiales bacterium]